MQEYESRSYSYLIYFLDARTATQLLPSAETANPRMQDSTWHPPLTHETDSTLSMSVQSSPAGLFRRG